MLVPLDSCGGDHARDAEPASGAEALADLFSDLAAGDPVAWIGFGGFFGVAGLLGLFVLKTKRDLDREDARRTKRYGRSK